MHHNWWQRYKLNRWSRGLLSAAYKIPALLLLLLFTHWLSSMWSLPTIQEISQVGKFLPTFPVSIWGSSEGRWAARFSNKREMVLILEIREDQFCVIFLKQKS